jgi:hypothetical protein
MLVICITVFMFYLKMRHVMLVMCMMVMRPILSQRGPNMRELRIMPSPTQKFFSYRLAARIMYTLEYLHSISLIY